ncbi:hypothetical protein E3U47_08025 [Pseudomonas sp. RIT623]|nr:hypothetical protein E3U47_08025 [Pseudomonas sp. RIT623]
MPLKMAHTPCGSGLASRKGCVAAPWLLKSWGRYAALSRRKAAPTEGRAGFRGLAGYAAVCRTPARAGAAARRRGECSDARRACG